MSQTMRNVLLIDEDEYPLKFYTQQLEEDGFKITQCFSVDCALRALANGKFDIVILDCMMPTGDNYANEDTQEGLRTDVFLYRDIRKVGGELPIIVLTNVTEQETLEQFQGDSFVRVVGKLDCPPAELVTQIREMLDDSGSLGGAA